MKLGGPKSDGLVHQGGSGLIPFGMDGALDPSWIIFGLADAPADKLNGRALVSFRSPLSRLNSQITLGQAPEVMLVENPFLFGNMMVADTGICQARRQIED